MLVKLNKQQRSAVCLLLLCLSIQQTGAQTLADLVHFADATAGAKLLAARDAYTDRWSWFDVHARLGRKGHPRELLEFAAAQTLDWTDEETGRITHIVNSLTKNIAQRGYRLQYPDSVIFVKSTCREEGGAEGYTRSNYIVLKEGFMRSPYNQTRKIVAHELFHVLSRNDTLMRRALYAVIGFERCNEVKLPPGLNRTRISNPDAPINNTFIRLRAGGDTVECMMIIYSDRPYTGGSFFSYLNLGLLQVAGAPWLKTVVHEGETPVLYEIDEVEGFYEQAGNNTRYIIHPEEILAENFVYALQGIVEVPNPEIIQKIDLILRGRDTIE